MGKRVRVVSILSMVLAAGCGSVTTSPDASSSHDAGPDAVPIDAMPVDPFVNGSFESADYTGWTLTEDSGTPDNGYWAIGADGTVFTAGTVIHDFTDGIDGSPGCFNLFLPTLAASDGTSVAFNEQNGPEDHRLSQDVTIPNGLHTLSWSMSYNNNATAFDLATQFVAIEVRDPTSDAVLANLFVTDPTTTAPPQSIPMTPFTADVSAYQGQTIRITVDVMAQQTCLFGSFDGFALVP